MPCNCFENVQIWYIVLLSCCSRYMHFTRVNNLYLKQWKWMILQFIFFKKANICNSVIKQLQHHSTPYYNTAEHKTIIADYVNIKNDCSWNKKSVSMYIIVIAFLTKNSVAQLGTLKKNCAVAKTNKHGIFTHHGDFTIFRCAIDF